MEPAYTISSPGAFGSGELKKNIEFPGVEGNKMSSNRPGHMTEMTITTIVLKSLKNHLRNQNDNEHMALKLDALGSPEQPSLFK